MILPKSSMSVKLKFRFRTFVYRNSQTRTMKDAIHVNKGPSLVITEPYRLGTIQLVEKPWKASMQFLTKATP